MKRIIDLEIKKITYRLQVRNAATHKERKNSATAAKISDMYL